MPRVYFVTPTLGESAVDFAEGKFDFGDVGQIAGPVFGTKAAAETYMASSPDFSRDHVASINLRTGGAVGEIVFEAVAYCEESFTWGLFGTRAAAQKLMTQKKREMSDEMGDEDGSEYVIKEHIVVASAVPPPPHGGGFVGDGDGGAGGYYAEGGDDDVGDADAIFDADTKAAMEASLAAQPRAAAPPAKGGAGVVDLTDE